MKPLHEVTCGSAIRVLTTHLLADVRPRGRTDRSSDSTSQSRRSQSTSLLGSGLSGGTRWEANHKAGAMVGSSILFDRATDSARVWFVSASKAQVSITTVKKG